MIEAPPEQVFAWHEQPEAFSKLIPPWQKVTLIQPPQSLQPGTEVHFKMHLGPFSILWIAEHTEYVPGVMFTDIQKKGPFRFWKHTHRMVPLENDRCLLVDEVEWELPGGKFVSLLFKKLVEIKLDQLFRFRHKNTQAAFQHPEIKP